MQKFCAASLFVLYIPDGFTKAGQASGYSITCIKKG